MADLDRLLEHDPEHVHEFYEDDYSLHCDGCADSFRALPMIRELQAERDGYAALIRSYESRARALRESHDALVTALREIASGTSGPLGRDGSSFDELFAYVTSVARAALAKAEALHA